jgi:hypothetical protein
MKLLLSISFKIVLLLFTATSFSSAWACGKNSPKNESAQTVSKCTKSCCKKAQKSLKDNCNNTKSCCKKQGSNTQKQKKGCCGDGDCQCSVSVTYLADLPKRISLPVFHITPVLNQKSLFYYKQVLALSSINDIWQPPISNLLI